MLKQPLLNKPEEKDEKREIDAESRAWERCAFVWFFLWSLYGFPNAVFKGHPENYIIKCAPIVCDPPPAFLDTLHDLHRIVIDITLWTMPLLFGFIALFAKSLKYDSAATVYAVNVFIFVLIYIAAPFGLATLFWIENHT